MKVRRMLFSEHVVIKLIALISYIGYFVDGAKSNSTCSCIEQIKASVSLDECKCYLGEHQCEKFFKNYGSTTVHDDSAMDVAILPYQQNFGYFPALPTFNITFQINNTKIKGFSYVLHKGCYTNDICRYLDFNSHKSSLSNAEFYSDKNFRFQERWGNDCIIEVKGLSDQLVPIYHKKFLTKIPAVGDLEQNCTNLKQWKSFVTVDQTDYKNESISIGFTTPPKWCNVTSFKVSLFENDELQSSEILEANTSMSVIYKLFHGIRPGAKYKVGVQIDERNASLCSGPCAISFSSVFNFEVQDFGSNMLTVVLIVTGMVLVTLIVCIIWMSRRKPGAYVKVVKVFMAYSHDVVQHVTVIEQLAEYLIKYCSCEVKLDIWHVKNQDPQFWVSDCISNADYVLIIWSDGAQLKMRKDNTKVLRDEPGYLGNDLFSTAMTSITSKINQELRTPQYWRNLRKFVNISFPYVPTNAVPSQFDYLPFYRLPSDFNALLCHFHGHIQSSFPCPLLKHLMCLVPCYRCYPVMPFSDLNEMEGKQLMDAINDMKKLDKKLGDLIQGDLPDINGACFVDCIESESDTSDSAADADSVSSEQSENELHEEKFPPPVHTLPVFGLDSCEPFNNCWPPSTRAPYSNCDPTADPLIDRPSQRNLPLSIFGPN